MTPEQQRQVVAKAIGMSLTDAAHWNPRVLLWLHAVKLTVADIARKSGEDVKHVTVNGHRNMWTIHYSEWIRAQWTEWAGSLGYSTKGLTPWHVPLREGHTDDEFDSWLAAPRYRVTAPSATFHRST